jgi:terminase large subunit-like protein
MEADLKTLRQQEKLPLVEQIRRDPAQAMILGGLTPDPWQAKLLRTKWTRALLLCSRQTGKSQVAGALALAEALTRPRSLILLLAQNQRASGELFRDKLLPLWRSLGRPLQDRPPTQLTLELSNGSRLVSLPTNEGGIRSYSGVRLLVVDEAARVPDDFYRSVRPMLAVSNGRLICMSTPFGKRGFFHEEWISKRKWERIRITAHQCPRITAEFLAEEKEAIGDRWFRQEYECSFEEMIGSVFRQEDIDAALTATVKPLFVSLAP